VLRADQHGAQPLGESEIAELLAPFCGARSIALAVSGGADSLGMMAAVARWRPASSSVLVLTVDHRLQRGSGKVAAGVATAARGLGLAVRVLMRKGPVPTGDIEAAARMARYTLMREACRAAGVGHLLLAHQRDDAAEGLLMRLNRGAGVFGLAGMRPWLDLGDIVIARPFLSVSRERLRATAIAAGLAPVDDPMNDDAAFERVRMRRALPLLAEIGIDADALANAAARLADAADAIDHAASNLLATAVAADACAVAWLDVARFGAEPHATRLRALARLVMAVGGEQYAPRHDRLAALHDAVLGDAGRLKRTLAGAVAERRGAQVAVYRETGRGGLPAVRLSPGTTGIWDHRFAYTVAPDAPRGLSLAPSGAYFVGHSPAVAGKMEAIPAGARAALPLVMQRGGAIAPSLIPEQFPSDSLGYVSLQSLLRKRLDGPPLFPGAVPG